MKLYFPLITSYLSEAQYIKIDKPRIPQVISSMDFNRSWLQSLRFRCHPYGRLQLKRIVAKVLIRKLRSIRDLLHKDDTSKAVKRLFHWYQYVSGISHPVLANPPHFTTFFNSIWANDLIRLRFKYQVQIKLPENNIQKPQRFNDRFIMDDIFPFISYITTQKQFNTCRLFLKITFFRNYRY